MIKKSSIELLIILCVSLFAAIIYNYSSGHLFKLFKTYKPESNNTIVTEKELAGIEKIDTEILKYFKDKKNTILLDARSREEFKKAHIPGAFSFPVSDFDSLFKERGVFLKTGKTIITYCTGGNCTDSALLAVKLKKRGVTDVLLYTGGIIEWKEKNNPTEMPVHK